MHQLKLMYYILNLKGDQRMYTYTCKYSINMDLGQVQPKLNHQSKLKTLLKGKYAYS